MSEDNALGIGRSTTCVHHSSGGLGVPHALPEVLRLAKSEHLLVGEHEGVGRDAEGAGQLCTRATVVEQHYNELGSTVGILRPVGCICNCFYAAAIFIVTATLVIPVEAAEERGRLDYQSPTSTVGNE